MKKLEAGIEEFWEGKLDMQGLNVYVGEVFGVSGDELVQDIPEIYIGDMVKRAEKTKNKKTIKAVQKAIDEYNAERMGYLELKDEMVTLLGAPAPDRRFHEDMEHAKQILDKFGHLENKREGKIHSQDADFVEMPKSVSEQDDHFQDPADDHALRLRIRQKNSS